jgi:hypothetical protein
MLAYPTLLWDYGIMPTLIETETAAGEGRRPFAPPLVAAALLDWSNYLVLDSIQDGTLPLAFDIARPGACRQFLRVATASVLAAQAGLKASADLERFFEATFPKSKPIYRAARLAWIWHCDYDHIYTLLTEGELFDAGGATRYQIPRESVLKFLTKRRVK